MVCVNAMREAWLNPIDEIDDGSRQCDHCLNNYHPVDYADYEGYCGPICWHLDNLGEVKKQILCWIKLNMNAEQIIAVMRKDWFTAMTPSTINRWKRAIEQQFNHEVSPK